MRVTVAAYLRFLARVSVSVTLAAVVLLVLASAGRTASSAAQLLPDLDATQAPTTPTWTPEPLDTPTPFIVREAPSTGLLFQQYLDEQYGPAGSRAAWYGTIRRVGLRFGTVVIQTDLPDGPESDHTATAISQAALGFRETAWGRQLTGLSVEVHGQRGQLLAQDRVPQPTAPTPSLFFPSS
jgi:hypothetical protein